MLEFDMLTNYIWTCSLWRAFVRMMHIQFYSMQMEDSSINLRKLRYVIYNRKLQGSLISSVKLFSRKKLGCTVLLLWQQSLCYGRHVNIENKGHADKSRYCQ